MISASPLPFAFPLGLGFMFGFVAPLFDDFENFDDFEKFEEIGGILMIRQYTNGRFTGTTMISGSQADLEAVAALCVGKVYIYDKKSEGGNTTPVSLPLNSFGFAVGKTYIDGTRDSSSVRLSHMKRTKDIGDVRAAVIGKWDASIQSGVKCEYANEFGNSSRG